MIFKSIYLKEGLFKRRIDFSKEVNLIHSDKNSKGKTTLLRFMLYALGYNIPNTKKIKFNQCEVELIVENEKKEEIKLVRNNLPIIQIEKNKKKKVYVIPEQQDELQEMVFGIENKDIISNLLGVYYIDQEKGWTLLNRGIVIGSIHFNIEELIRGLSGINCTDLIEKETQLKRKISKYKQMLSIAEYQQILQNEKGLVTNSYEDKIDSELDSLLIKQREIKEELRRIDKILSDNKHFKKFVIEMKLLVKTSSGEIVPVTENNIVGLNDAIELLVTKRKLTFARFVDVTSKIEKKQKKFDKEYEQLKFFELVNQLEIFDKRISSIPLNRIIIKQEITNLEKEVKDIREEISRITKNNNTIGSYIFEIIIKYATELKIGDKNSISPTYLFTSNLKELSGAILHKTVFAFKLGYISAIKKKLNIKLPILLDSPTGKEVDQENIKLMMNILKRDFSDHQIIIASIFEYDFNNVNTIEIKNRLIEIF
ncbi:MULTISPECIES: AAA family ATPase [Fusobacterium]|jgi:hypothetical protein|uniref:Rad50/SbcC-type AAA domain-containing protein n=1 Tax=Fusobacterium nucleatum TaxID=851 RepID=A0AAX3MA95_FUSNU|nr:AAA family ATPase [Fusobacterium nucleatum]WDA43619.1 hypothetical protein PSR69_08025 [Fusobacterium nucleatum]